MPSPAEILQGLTRMANDAYAVAVAWHLVVAATLSALASGWRPSRRLAAGLASLPAASAAIVAFVFGNAFNGSVLALTFWALGASAFLLPRERVQLAPTAWWIVGAAMLAFAWVYPHFLEGRPAIAYLFGAPIGVIPCPTLSLMIGLWLLADGFRARASSLSLAGVGLFYGVFGVAHLGVTLDLGLIAGALALGAAALTRWPQSRVVSTTRRSRLPTLS